MNKPLCIISSPPDTFSGYGARARDFIKALVLKKGNEWDIKILLQRWGNTPWGYIAAHEKEWGWLRDHFLPENKISKQPDYWFQITVPNEFQAVGKWNCGVTAGIETTLCHPSWLEGCNRMNLVLVSSNHAKRVFQDTKIETKDQNNNTVGKVELKAPVEVLFEGVDLNKYFAIEDNDLPESDLVLEIDEIEEDFCFLFVGHWLPGVINEDRKNVGYLIKVFLETFKNRKTKPALILKASGGVPSIVDRDQILDKIQAIKNTVTGDMPNVYLIHGDFSEEEINHLYNHPKVKVMISLTKGEGFGRPLLEFTQAKKPIIVSGWSGQLDFLDSAFNFLLSGTLNKIHPSAVAENMLIPESSWFQPDPIQTRDMIDLIYTDYKKYLDLAKRQAHKSKTQFSFDAMVHLLDKILEERTPKFQPLILPKMPALNIPKLIKTTENG